MSKYKYQKQFLFSTKKLEDIELYLQNQETPLDLMLIRDGKKNTAIHHCSYMNQHRHIDYYIKYYRRNLENQGFTLSEMKNRTKLLLDQKNEEGLTAAHYAAFKGNITVLKSLQKYEANLLLTSDLGMNLLHFAAQGDKISTILYLHDQQLDINVKDSKSSTPLHWACFSGSEKIVDYLLVQPAISLDEPDLEGHTPLHVATAYGYSKIVKKLLIAGCDRELVDLKNQNALQIARENEFQKIGKMLDNKYSLVDYLKFICNTKVRYQPRSRSYSQPLIFYLFTLLILFLSYFTISIDVAPVLYAQSIVYALAILLFTSLILTPRMHIKLHSYGYFAEREEINHLCMECLRPMQQREYHCPTCRLCVAQYDHHCFWINNCVGKHNLLRFNLFLLVTELSMLWTEFLALRLFVLLQQGGNTTALFTLSEWADSQRVVVSVVCLLLAIALLFLAVPMCCLILVQQKNLLLGKTSYERFSKSNESVLTRDDSDFLGRSWESGSPPSLKNCMRMCFQGKVEDKWSQSNSTSSSFIREH